MFEYLAVFGARFLICVFLVTLVGIVVAGVVYSKTVT
jgi:hypothetical protein